MKFIFFPAILFYVFSNTIGQQRIDIKFIVDNRLRESILVIPSKSPPKGGYPIVVMLHSSQHDGEEPYYLSGWKELGEQENFITVFPSSLKWCYVEDGVEGYRARWVNGNVIEFPCTGPPQDYIDDVKFLKILVSKISDTLPINLNKVFASGFSNGSAMIHKLAMDAGDVFAAVAGAGGYLARTDSILNPTKRIPIWFMLGNQDSMYIFPPFTELPFGDDSILVYLNKPLTRVLACQGLTASFIKNESSLTHTYIYNEGQPFMQSRPYLFTLVKGMKHTYPNGNNFPLEAAKLFWEFFNLTSLDGTKNDKSIDELVTIYPNPSTDIVKIHINQSNKFDNYRIEILNSLGNVVLKSDNKTEFDFEINKNKIGTGTFLLQINLGNKLICKKLLLL